VIEIKDDGKGLNRDRILAKAIERGLAKPGETLSNSQIFKMILEPGFSTAEKITDLSGRGVGMDVVQRNIDKLRGKLEIQSVAGEGTTFSIHLPLTLAIIDGLLVGVGTHRFIVPTLLVRESFRPTAEMISTVQGRGELVNVRGRLCPLLRLYDHLGITPCSTDPAQSIVLVVEAGSAIRCVMVDNLLGKQEVVIKSLGETFRENPYVAGAVILGDGGVGLILDPQSLVHLNSERLAAAA
jgi:two-component system chemotaxis sensor kinase CheA